MGKWADDPIPIGMGHHTCRRAVQDGVLAHRPCRPPETPAFPRNRESGTQASEGAAGFFETPPKAVPPRSWRERKEGGRGYPQPHQHLQKGSFEAGLSGRHPPSETPERLTAFLSRWPVRRITSLEGPSSGHMLGRQRHKDHQVPRGTALRAIAL